jgi:hypothetical protein
MTFLKKKPLKRYEPFVPGCHLSCDAHPKQCFPGRQTGLDGMKARSYVLALMRPSIRFLACALAAVAPFWWTLRAADAPPPVAGRLLLLENERTVEGRIEQEGDQYRIHREAGETTVPASQVLCLCDTPEDAYAYLRARANLRDPDERLRLARWCHLHGLRIQAVAEITAAVEMRPHHAESQGLLQTFRRSAATVAQARPTLPEPAATSLEPTIEVSAELMGQFVTRVQPVLMNTCASCHVAGRGGSFKLVRALEGGVVSPRATQHNLHAVLAQIQRAHWEGSPLLIKAVSMHGLASQPPLKSRQTPAFRNLEDWVRGAVANQGPVLEHPSVGTPAAVVASRVTAETATPRPEAPGGEAGSAPRPAPSGGSPPQASPTSGRGAMPSSNLLAPPAPVDPFDPVIFNQQMHPQGR